jgi:hypothetical protein
MTRGRSGRGALACLLVAALELLLQARAHAATAVATVTPAAATDCRLALYDDEAMTQTSGAVSGVSKTLYLGIRYDATTPAQLTGIEFSIRGLEALNVFVEPRDNAAIVLGTPAAPAGLDSLYGTGGMNIAWTQCLAGDRVLAQLTLVPKNGWPEGGTVLEVLRRYPPTNAALPYPLIVDCDDPYFTARGVRGGRFQLGVAGTPVCSLSGETDFGSVPLGNSVTRSLQITNIGLGFLEGTLSLSGGSFFEFTTTDLSYALSHGQQKSFAVRFSPPEAGQYSDSVAGAGCSPLDLTGRGLPPTTISALHHDPTYIGTEVTVEAQVFIPANHAGGVATGWIQDGSGRGIQVHGNGAANPLLYDTGNQVRVTGTVSRSGTTLRLDPVRFVTLLSSGQPPLTPAAISIREASSSSWEGSYIEVTGTVTARVAVGTAMQYLLTQNTSSMNMVIPSLLGVPTLPLNEVVVARGAGGFDTRYLVWVGNRADLLLPGIPVCSSGGDVDFGAIPLGSSATQSGVIRNAGTGVLRGTLSLSGENFQLVDTNPSYALLHGEEKVFTVRFSPPAAGEYTCTVQGTDCEPVHFSGRMAAAIPIAALHLNTSYIGSERTVEAQVTIPADHAGGEPTGWIQDDSGRGIQVHGAGAASAALNSTGNLVRVTGTVSKLGTTLRLDPVRFVTLISGGHPPRVPVLLTPHDAASASWEGTFIEVTGAVGSRRLVGTTMRYVASDSWGSVTIAVPNALMAPAYQVGDVITARGVGGFDGEYLLHVGQATDVGLSGAPGCLGRRIIVGDVAGNLGQQVEIPLHLQWNPRPIDAYGLRVVFDGTALRFAGSRCCGLTAGWQTCEARAVGRDTVVVGGFNPVPIPSNSDGVLLCLTFEITACEGERHLTAFGLVDDLVGMETCDGTLSCTECLSSGDVNQDGVLTPQDAQCAFRTFLEGQSVPADCDAAGHCEVIAGDVNCDAVVTPGDAVEIFDRWLGGNSSPGHCFARPAASSEAFRCGAPAVQSFAGGEVTVPIEMRAAPGHAAFALEIDFDPAGAEFVELQPAPAGVGWPALAAQIASPGHLRAGGFDPRGVAGSGWVPIAQLVFRTTPGSLHVQRVEWRERITGASTSQPEALFVFDLGPPYPNPLRSGTVTLPLVVPAGATQDIVVGIHDVSGRLVRLVHGGGTLPAGPAMLTWDGTDGSGKRVAAGIYLVSVQSGTTTRERKLVVLQ